jgi:hypothetical protein
MQNEKPFTSFGRATPAGIGTRHAAVFFPRPDFSVSDPAYLTVRKRIAP